MEALITLLITAVICLPILGIIIYFIWTITASKKNKEIIEKFGVDAEAVVEEIKYYSNRRYFRVIAYYKNPVTGQEHHYRSHTKFRRKPDVQVGDKVKIKVYPKDSKYYSFRLEG